MVAQAAVNRCVTGSSPVTGASYQKRRFESAQPAFLFALENRLRGIIGGMDAARRWTRKDPIKLNGGNTNLFCYVHHDPIYWIAQISYFYTVTQEGNNINFIILI